jgi:glutathione S-transferase
MADIPSGSLTHRWFHWTPKEALPSHPNVRAWYERLAARPAYQEHVIKVNAKRTQEIAAQG